MNAHKKPIGTQTVEDVLDAEAWRDALIAFYRAESPWMTQKVENLKLGNEFSRDDLRIIQALVAASNRIADRGMNALHLRGPCKRGHPVTVENTVSVGLGNGYRCKECRQRIKSASLARKAA